ncbi:hypothetical protein PV08_10646 [Exophiala spinifera]|uniref:Xylanolytic transcriptional activator regulatory domain-containing protein n=1 Tax=Exophiala spinifera TaxID=91928 RepID=A0A0D1Y8M4_9EURO|nr:uncharacterized protein PV08_10646 [Exophiala spinifera]KIW11346.1 hypothetical protein PV08_10646 [Exophiala spinifera]
MHTSPSENGRTSLHSPVAYLRNIDIRDDQQRNGFMTINSHDGQPAEPIVQTLEDGKDMTAHSLGLCSEQDTNLLASFRSVIMNETNRVAGDIMQVHPGSCESGTPPVHFFILRDWFMPYDNQIKDEASRVIESTVEPYGPDLVRLYFKHVHPVNCVVSKVRFLRAYKEDKLSIPASLRGAIYAMGGAFWNQDPVLRTVPRNFEQYELFQAAQASLERELEAPNLWRTQACLLMIHERAANNTTFETPRLWTLSARAVSCAQMVGLHRDPSEWNIAPWEKSLRRKLWWSTYVTDMWTSVSHGNPPHIYRASYTTSDLSMDDLRVDEDVPEDLADMVDESSSCFDASTAARFLEMVKLTQLLHTILETSFYDESYRNTMLNPAVQEIKLVDIQTRLESWHSLIPHCVTMGYNSSIRSFRNNGPLHLAYFAVQIILFRALMTPASMTAKYSPKSSLQRYFGAAMDQVEVFLAFMDGITAESLRAFWGRHGRSQLILIGNFLIYLFLLSSNPEQVHATFRLLERFHESLQRIGEHVDEESVCLIRPVALRIDSFFTQAAKIMRRASTSGSYTAGSAVSTSP